MHRTPESLSSADVMQTYSMQHAAGWQMLACMPSTQSGHILPAPRARTANEVQMFKAAMCKQEARFRQEAEYKRRVLGVNPEQGPGRETRMQKRILTGDHTGAISSDSQPSPGGGVFPGRCEAAAAD